MMIATGLDTASGAGAGAKGFHARRLLVLARPTAGTKAKTNGYERDDRLALDVDRLTDNGTGAEKTLDFGQRCLQQAFDMIHRCLHLLRPLGGECRVSSSSPRGVATEP